MLDTDTKRKIDKARDILVGKVPDPKTQVEQITFALIYKFMDNMDQQSVGLGGKPSFFTNGYEQYAWSRLMDRRMSGADRLDLYVRALEQMSQNPYIPQLFRDIFKGAFLPYRDSETLNLFLKELDGFRYDHSEDLGDAYEYLLNILGTQGKAGQFRTPRHIIDFIVRCVDPDKNETVLDPACGTAGFLISAFKHIEEKYREHPLSPDEKKRLTENFTGYDIAPDMVRLSRVNMYLHQFPNPTIHEYDTLTTEDRWDDSFDVILANPPFMTPKGGIRPHNRFAVRANRSEVLFVDYIAEHLNPGGRAGIIVPEGIIFQSSNAYKALRKMLVEGGYLYAVVSLPAGVFNPYSGVKTSILLLDKSLARRTDKVLFVKINYVGYDLGAQKREIEENDFPSALSSIRGFIDGSLNITDESGNIIVVSKSQIAQSNEYNLSSERYRSVNNKNTLTKYIYTHQLIMESHERVNNGIFPIWSVSNRFGFISTEEYFDKKITSSDISKYKLVKPGYFAYNPSRINVGSIAVNETTLIGAVSPMYVVFSIIDDQLIDGKFLFLIFKSSLFNDEVNRLAQGAVRTQLRFSDLSRIQIPVPPLEVQQEIVAEIEGYQKVIDGARQVVENYKPVIPIDPSWPLVKLGDVCDVYNGSTPSRAEAKYWENGTIPWFTVNDIRLNGRLVYSTKQLITEKAVEETSVKLLPKDTVLICCTASVGEHAIAKIPMATNQQFNGLVIKPKFIELLNSDFLFYLAGDFKIQLRRLGGTTAFQFISARDLKSISIPLPPINEQEKIVEMLDQEEELLKASTTIIERFTTKITSIIQRLWQER